MLSTCVISHQLISDKPKRGMRFVDENPFAGIIRDLRLSGATLVKSMSNPQRATPRVNILRDEGILFVGPAQFYKGFICRYD